ncbi:Methyltransferase type 12 [Streptomyces violaceusniger Tu 4113]|uniref:Methyltransferase type 12 n=1 Tax=Streptomyces violaceusniger (strain Tu 4113) TaxID=653045 RepID=G2P218_STRV4|nr:Methyltransferase type 12 [Streptomyces violaceusniger Tu 4113]
MTDTVAVADWQAWQRSWDRQQEWYLPDREERFRVMLDAVEAVVGPEPRILDLACGTGSISDRALGRFPGATSTGVDLDPALLTIARGHFAAEPRAEFVTADLRDPGWTGRLPHGTYDAVLTATALHWLRSDELRVLYGQIAGVVREGGVFLNADHMPARASRTGRSGGRPPHGTRRSPHRWPSGSRSSAIRRTATTRTGRHSPSPGMPRRCARGASRRRGPYGARPRTRWCSG